MHFTYVQTVLYIIFLAVLSIPLGYYMAVVLEGSTHPWLKPLRVFENLVYRLSGIDPAKEMTWREYTLALCLFNLVGFLFVLLLQLTQAILPLNPQSLPNVPVWLSINTAISFVTNTNWQAYSGEATMSYLTQMLGLAVQNFLSAATGLAVIVALAKGLTRKNTYQIGNFWQDMTRSTIYILLPCSVIFAIVLVQQGVIQNFSPYISATTLEGAMQRLPMGPAASQIAIKQLGSNGGGFFGVNSAHPFENPTPLTNFLQMLALLLIPAAVPIAFGKMIANKKHGYALFVSMLALFLIMLSSALVSEFSTNSMLDHSAFLEGKETRFGIEASTIWAIATTAASNGSVNAMHSSLSPLTGGLAMLNMMLGEVIFGGVGAGLYGMIVFVILAVFIAGLMVGRSPEYLGKKIEAREMKYAVVAILAPCAVILIFSAYACVSSYGLSSIANKGPHGLSEILYAFSSAVGNNGSAFAGLNANTDFYNSTTAVAMLIGRFAVIVPILAIAGSLAAKKTSPVTNGSFPTDGPLFITLLCGTILIVGALTFFPALVLGPIVEQLAMLSGRSF